MKRPLAWRHLARIYEMVSVSSVPRVAGERGLFESKDLEAQAAADRSAEEEALALAHDHGWVFPEPEPYRWDAVKADEALTLPRLIRSIDRDVFELDEIVRNTDDDEVCSLALRVRQDRQALLGQLDEAYPGIMLPGAK